MLIAQKRKLLVEVTVGTPKRYPRRSNWKLRLNSNYPTAANRSWMCETQACSFENVLMKTFMLLNVVEEISCMFSIQFIHKNCRNSGVGLETACNFAFLFWKLTNTDRFCVFTGKAEMELEQDLFDLFCNLLNL